MVEPDRTGNSWTGGLFIATGIAFLAGSFSYPTGSAAQMGPGYFPALVSILLIVVGSLLLLWGDGWSSPQRGGRYRTLILVAAAASLFGYAVELLGLGLTAVGVAFLVSLGTDRGHVGRAFALSVSLAVAAIGLFVYALELPLPILPASFN